MTLKHRTIRRILAFAGLATVACGAFAQTAYPTRPIRLVVPYPPGSGTDFTAREVSAIYNKALGPRSTDRLPSWWKEA